MTEAVPRPALSESIEDAERAATKLLLPELQGHLNLIQDAMNVIGEVISLLGMRPVQECSQSFKVTSLLLIRLANDIRCMGLLAARGYPLQTLTLCASVFEVGITIAYIGDSDDLAQEWLDHDKPEQPFRKLEGATRDVFKKCGIDDPEKQAAVDYRVYQQLCMAKHANPLLQTGHGLIEQGQEVTLRNGPDTSEIAVNNLCYALDHAARYVYVALARFATSHLPHEQQARISERVNELAAKREELRRLARTRWGTKDPLEGKWRTNRSSQAQR